MTPFTSRHRWMSSPLCACCATAPLHEPASWFDCHSSGVHKRRAEPTHPGSLNRAQPHAAAHGAWSGLRFGSGRDKGTHKNVAVPTQRTCSIRPPSASDDRCAEEKIVNYTHAAIAERSRTQPFHVLKRELVLGFYYHLIVTNTVNPMNL